MFFSAGLAPARGPTPIGAADPASPPAPAAAPALPPGAVATCGRFTAADLRGLHRGRRPPAGSSPATASCCAARRRRTVDRPDHRADAARAGRAGHPVRPRPGRRERPPDRRGRRPGQGRLVRRRPRRRGARARPCATRSATGSTSTSPAPARTRAPASATRWRAASAPAAAPRPAAPSSAPAYPGLPGAAPVLGRQRLPLEGGPQVVVNPAGGNPAAITSLPGLGGALGASSGRLAAFTAELPGQSAQFRTPPLEASHAGHGRSPGGDHGRAGPGPAGAGARPCCSARSTRSRPDGLRTLLGGAVAPIRVAGARRRLARGRHGDAARGRRARSRPATGWSSRSRPPTRATPASLEPAVWSIGLVRRSTGSRSRCRWCPGDTITANTVPLGPLIGIAVVLGLAAARLGRCARPAAVGARPRPAGVDGLAPLEIADLAKTYQGGFSAVKGVSFTVERGMVLGLLGPNGAGKTTVLRMLMGLIRPDGGHDQRVRRAGRARARRCWPGSARSSRARGSCRTCPARTTCGCTGPRPAGPAGEAHIDGGAGDRRARRASIDRRVGTYSQGMRQRLAIAQAMLGPAGPAGARRADQRPRPAADPRDARGAAPLRRRRAHRAGVQPPARRGGADLHARRRHAPRPGRRRRHGRGDHRRRRRGDVHRGRPGARPRRCSAGWPGCTRCRGGTHRCTPS